MCCVYFTRETCSMFLLAGEIPVWFTHRSLPCQCYSAIAGCWWVISGRDPV
ncbi:unnamed protein product, partial [Staurois parvus]